MAIPSYPLRGRTPKNNPFIKALLGSVWGLWLTGAALAAPVGGVVSAGSASITGQNTANVSIHQNSQRVVIHWNSFDSSAGETTTFYQPNSNSIALNRINNGTPTNILGNLRANGKVIVMNPNGVVLGESAHIDVNGLVATTATIDNKKFMHGDKLVFNHPGNPDAAVINKGTITAGDAGLVGLIAPHVENSGVIDAKLGKVRLASGDTFTLDLAGDDLVNIAVSDNVAKQLVVNSGTIRGGNISITAANAAHVVNKMIVNTGSIEATSISQKGGKIILGGDGAVVIHKGVINATGTSGGNIKITGKTIIADGITVAAATNGTGGTISVEASDTIAVSATNVMDVFGIKAGSILLQSPWVESGGIYLAQSTNDTGGSISLLGDHLYVSSTSYLDASGQLGGGNIYVGGDMQGHGSMHTATDTTVDQGAMLVNDAYQSGNGGQTIVWANDTTEFFGTILARGKGLGHGGATEVSGKEHLNFQGNVDLTSESGVKGTLLLDPTTITVYGNVDPTFVSTDNSINLASHLNVWLDAADKTTITLTYSTDALSGATASGSIGTNTITTSVNVASSLRVGARIRLGVAGGASTADTLGSNTYTIASISGTTITTVESLTNTYAAQTLNRGLVSSWADKSAPINSATQSTDSLKPLFVDNAINGLSAINFNNDYMTTGVLGVTGSSSMAAFLGVKTYASTNGGGSDGAGSYYWDRSPAGNPLFDLKVIGGQYSLQRRFDDGSGLTGLSTTTAVSALPTLLSIVRNPGVSMTINVNGAQENTTTDSGAALTPDGFRIGTHNSGSGGLNADYMDLIFYDNNLTSDMRALIDQYQSAKWNVALNAPGTGGTENAKATSATGYNVFTTDYLERLSQTADVNLLATNLITLDLKGDNLTLANDRNISFTTTNGNITSLSSGTITTNRTAAGGNISFNAGGTGGIDIGNVTLNAQNGGVITVNAGGDIYTGAITSGGVTIQTTGVSSKITANAINVGLGNLSLTADDVVLNGDLTGNGGILTLQPNATSRVVNINNGTDNGSTFHLNTADVGHLANGWGSINIGRTNGVNDVFIGASNWNDPVNFRNNFRMTVLGAVSGAGNASISFTGTSGWVDLYNSITTANQKVDFSGSTYVWVGSMAGGGVNTSGGDVLFNRILSQNNGNMNIQSGGGDISVLDTIYGGAGSGKTYTFDAGSGDITFGNTVNAAANITVIGNGITLGNVWGNSTTLGAVSLTTTGSALSLPNIHASSIFAESAAGYNLNVTGALVATGGGNSVVLNSGKDFINSGSINPGSGRYLIYSADPALNSLGGLSGFTKRYNKTYAGYNPGSVTETGNVFLYSIAPTITVTADNAIRYYGDVDPTLTASYAGFIDGDTVLTALSGSPDLTPGSTILSGVGAYTITTSVGSLLSTMGYGLNFVDGTLTINPAALTITADNQTKIYGDANPTLTASYSSFKNGETSAVISGLILGTAVDNLTGVGSYAITASGATASNYAITQVDGTIAITPASLTVTADDQTKVSGTANPVFTLNVAGLRNGDLYTLFTGYTLSSLADNSSPAGIYLISLVGGNAGSNYTVTNIDGNLTVTPAPDMTPDLPYKQLWQPGDLASIDTEYFPQAQSSHVAELQKTCLYKLVNFDGKGSVSSSNCGGNK